MNGDERYRAILKGDPADFLPRTPILMQFAAEYIGSDYAAFASDYRILVKANVVSARDFGIDQLSCISDPYRETHGFGARIEYRKDGPPRSSHPLQEAKDLSILAAPDPLTSERMRDRVMAARSLREKASGQYSVLGWIEGPAAEAADLRNAMNFLMDLIDDPPFACELMDRCADAGVAFARAQVDAGADTIGIGDAIASQVSPGLYERFIQPREKRMVQAVKQMGAFVKLHICGNITHLLPGISDLGVDILDVDHMVRMQSVREAVGRDTALTGNLDPVGAVQRGTPASIRKDVLRIYEEAGNPYFVNAGCEIPPGTPADNLKALCQPVPWSR